MGNSPSSVGKRLKRRNSQSWPPLSEPFVQRERSMSTPSLAASTSSSREGLPTRKSNKRQQGKEEKASLRPRSTELEQRWKQTMESRKELWSSQKGISCRNHNSTYSSKQSLEKAFRPNIASKSMRRLVYEEHEQTSSSSSLSRQDLLGEASQEER
ncbi:hypothetical protein QOT17_021523 [Balamuthia mandrillaris]